MKYICLAYEEERTLDRMSPERWRALRQETLACVDDLTRRGMLQSAAPLRSVRHACTVRVRGGSVQVTDGPFAETKETLGGFFIIEARDLNEAIAAASRWPSARFGSIEVRPLEEALREDGRYEPIAKSGGEDEG